MNNEILNQYKVYMYKASNGRKHIECKNAISSFLYIWKNIDEIDEFLRDIDLALNAQYDSIKEPFLRGFIDKPRCVFRAG
ncbi:MAG: hypothetical protein JWN56_1288 [Sphingobacteriales bacterium]|nr:hypothetical protein [Sphingobacteriales bacterium]